MVEPLCLGALILGSSGCMTADERHGRSAGRYIDDKAIAAEVKDVLEDDPLYKFDQLHVDAYRGTIQLSGFALNDAQKERAREIASSVRGVLGVENNISIVAEPKYSRDLDESRTIEGRQPARDPQPLNEPK